MTNVQKLNEPNVTGYFDSDKRIFYVHYKGILDAEATNKAYTWLFTQGTVAGGIENIHAFVFDFTKVLKFRRDNTFATKKQSQTVKVSIDLSRVPAALVVKNIYQEQMVLLSTKVNDVEERTKICRSHAEALTFIDLFHLKLAKKDMENTKKSAGV